MRRTALVLALTTSACTQTATQIVGIVGSDYPTPDLLSEVRVSATIGSDRVDGHVFSLATVTLPLSFGVTPGDDGVPDDFLTLEVEARSTDGRLSVRRAVLPFVEHRAMAVPLFLAASCRDVSCEEGHTCTESGCAPEALDPTALADVTNGGELASIPPSATPSTPITPNPDPMTPRYALQVRDVDATLGAVKSTNMAGIDCGSDCSEMVLSTTSVTLQAYPSPTAVFDGWTGDCSGMGPCTVSMATPRIVGARFRRNDTSGATFPLSVSIVGGGHGRVYTMPGSLDCPTRCGESFPAGTSVTLYYEVPSDSVFHGWSGDCSGMAACTVTLDRVRNVQAQIRLFGAPPVANPLDVTGDGLADLVFAAPRVSSGAGRVYLTRSPLASRIDASSAADAWDGMPGSRLGEAIALPGDMTGDGFSDVLAGAPGINGGDGGVFMIPGGPALPQRGGISSQMVGGTPGSAFGASLAVLPDLDADGRGEIAVGAPGNGTTPGAVFVFLSAGAMVRSAADAAIVLSGEHPGDGFGTAIAWVGDVDGDGQGELAVGAPGARNASRITAGRVYVFAAPHRSTIRTAAMANWILSGDGPNHAVGTTIAALGDWNRDGRDDFAIAALLDDAVFVYPPRVGQGAMSSGFVGNAPLVLTASGMAGSALAGGGDVTGDGVPDLLVGAPAYAGNERGAVLVYAGGGTIETEPLVTLAGTCADESRCAREAVGTTVANLGDLDGDGRADFATGSLFGGGAAGSPARGRISVFASGRASLMSTSIESAPIQITGEDQAGMCAMLPGAGGRLPPPR